MRSAPPSAEVTALRALAWLVGDEDRTMRFLAITGCDAEALRRRAGEPEVLGAVLDFLLEDEAALLDFAAFADMPPNTVAAARRFLPGTMEYGGG